MLLLEGVPTTFVVNPTFREKKNVNTGIHPAENRDERRWVA